MFTIKDVDFQSDDYGVEPYLNNWPMLYILENGKKAYVGQTNSINKRMSQHKEADSKKIFTKAHFIYCDKFNQSATFDYESRLISLMAADAQFVLTNQNAGLSGIEYYDKLTYDQEFVELWKELQKSGASIVMHAIFAALLGVTGIMGLLFIMIALSQAKTVLNCNGNVDVTFWNIKKSA